MDARTEKILNAYILASVNESNTGR